MLMSIYFQKKHTYTHVILRVWIFRKEGEKEKRERRGSDKEIRHGGEEKEGK